MPTPLPFVKVLAGLSLLCWTLSLPAQPRLVKDINTLTNSYYSLLPHGLAPVNGRLYFNGNTFGDDGELWQSDGTTAGTTQVRDINPGRKGSFPEGFTGVNGRVFFSAVDAATGRELWLTDGTAAGTVRVKDVNPGGPAGLEGSRSWFTGMGNTLFFVANNGVTGYELWKSDGTEAGTVPVKDIWPGQSGSNPTNLVELNGTLYFAATDGTTGTELWKSDGTAAGTVRVKDINPRVNSAFTWYPLHLVKTASHLFFFADNGVHGRELWKTDGTEAGTVLVRDIFPGSTSADPNHLTNVNGTLFFAAQTDPGGVELWKSDGTPEGTVGVKDIHPGTAGSRPDHLTSLGNILYFTATDAARGRQLWKSDGTAAGTVLIKEVYTDFIDEFNPFSLAAGNDRLYFAARSGLWVSDGTGSGTRRISEHYPWFLTRMGEKMFFSAGEGDGIDRELWRSDGTPEGTLLVKALPGATTQAAFPQRLTPVNGTVYFTATDGTAGNELWRSDGTAAGTVRVKDINPGPGSAFTGGSSQPANINGTLYFAASTPATGVELWKSDGTEGGTVLVTDALPGLGSSFPASFTPFGNQVYFVAYTPDAGRELWRSDGTAAGTVRVKDINPGTGGSSPGNLYVVNGALYFIAQDDGHGRELWRSDGTAAGTVRVKDITPGAGNGFLHQHIHLTPVGNLLYFAADDGANGLELWRSDGTESGTRLVKDIVAGAGGGFNPGHSYSYLTPVDGGLYFVAGNHLTGDELWKSDGTEAGTVPVKDIRPGYGSGFDHTNPGFTAVNGVLFFRADDGVSGRELWKSDGTAAGTVRVKDIYPGLGESSPQNLVNVGGTLLFVAYSDPARMELWQSDGTEAGTRLVEDLNPEGSAFSPEVAVQLADHNGVLYFAADDGLAGVELWQYRPAACRVPDPSLAVVGDTVCPARSATLTVKSTQSGVTYQVYRENAPVGEPLAGGGDLAFPIPAGSLTAGANVLGVRATGCAEVPLTQTATVVLIAGADAPLVKDTTITAGQAATLAAAGAPAGSTYRWYTQATGATPVATGTPFTTPVLAADTAYYVSVYRADCFESVRTKVTVRVKPAVVSAVEPAGAAGRLVVSPNPAGQLLHVVFPVPLQSPGTVRLYNATGKLLREVQPPTGTRTCTLDVSALSAGVYSLQVGTAREKWVRKVVKQ